MHKKGQVTIFILIGILIIVMISSLLFYNSESMSQKTDVQEDITSDVNAVTSFVNSCIKQSLKSGLENISLCNITGLQNYVDIYSRICVRNNLGIFEGLNITELSRPRSNITLTSRKDGLIVDVDYSLKIRKIKSTAIISEFYLDYHFPIKRTIQSIGDEGEVSSENPARQMGIDTDLKNQPHIVLEVSGSLYSKINGTWNSHLSFIPQFAGRPPGTIHIGIDSVDRAWITSAYVTDFGHDFDVGGRKCCIAMSLIENMSDSANPFIKWGPSKINAGFVATIALDPDLPNQAYEYDQNSGLFKWSLGGTPNRVPSSINVIGGEIGAIAVSARDNADSIIHIIGNTYYQNTLMPQGVEWIYRSGGLSWFDDHDYVGLGVDLDDPNVAYLSGPNAGGLALNIWDGTQLLYSKTRTFQIDSSTLGESSNGGVGGRILQGWASADGGGAFVCWTSGNNHIMLKYISVQGECFFGDTINVGPGQQCAITTDSNGDIHMVYNNGGVRYRKIITQ